MEQSEFEKLGLIEKIEHLRLDFIISDVLDELHKAVTKHPSWPRHDAIHAAAIVQEEAGELIRAALQFHYEDGSPDEIHKEAIQTAAMGLRFLAETQS